MAYPLSDYVLKPGLSLGGIQGLPFQIYNTMFVHNVNGGTLPADQLPMILTNISNCTPLSGSIIVPGAGTYTFQLSSVTSVITGTARSSLQPPISIGQIHDLLGEDSYSLNHLYFSPNINQMSPSKPNTSVAPHIMGFNNYCHYADSGFTYASLGATTIPNGTYYTVGLSVTQKDTLPSGYDMTQTMVVFDIAGHTSTKYGTGWQFYQTYTSDSWLNNNTTGSSVGGTAKFYAKLGGSYTLIESVPISVTLAGSTASSVTGNIVSTSYSVRDLSIYMGLTNSSSSAHTCTFRATLYGIGGPYTVVGSSAVVPANSTAYPTSIIHFASHNIQPSDTFDLFMDIDGSGYQMFASGISVSMAPGRD